MHYLKILLKYCVLFSFGGITYNTLERMARGHTHWTMFIVGGLCFCMIGLINEVIPWEMAFWKQCVIGGCIVTAIEFVSGCIINLWLGWHVWDYSNMPFNILGQICLPFSLLWCVVSAVAIVCDDYLRYWFFNEEKPVYKLF